MLKVQEKHGYKCNNSGLLVSVIIAERNSQRTIGECLKSLLKQNFSDYEIIVVDGLSEDDTLEIVRNFPVKILSNPKITRSTGRNLGIKHANGKIVAFIDGDCIADKRWLSRLVNNLTSTFEQNVVGVGGPNLTPPSDPYMAKCIGLALSSYFGSGGSVQGYAYSEPKFVESISTCNSAYWKRILLDIGCFDEKLKGVAEDADLNYRILKKKYRLLYVPDAIIWHHRKDSLQAFFKQMHNYGYWRARASRDRPGMFRPRYILVLFLTIVTILLLMLSLFYKVLSLPAIFIITGYVCAVLLTGLKAYIKTGDMKHIGLIPLILVIEHFAFITGLFRGLIK